MMAGQASIDGWRTVRGAVSVDALWRPQNGSYGAGQNVL